MTEPLLPADLDWTADEAPRSRTFGDVYFSAEGGLDETRAVFLAGCGLPDAWVGRDRLVLAETGFGTGLNIMAALDLWRRTRKPEARLRVFSVEAHPLLREDARRAHAAWPELAEISAALLEQWPAPTPGFHRIDLPQWGATIDLGHGEAAEMLTAWQGRADAWFLDGFAPALNPQMWRAEVLNLVAARSAPGARLASFTVAGGVRRGLAAAGFSVEKKPGYGRKRERLEATRPGSPALARKPEVLIIGAGVAGAALARAFSQLGCPATVVEAISPGAAASGAPAALVTPRLDAGLGPVADLGAQAFQRAVALYRETAGAVLARGVLRLARDDRDAGRLARIADQPLWPPEALDPLGPADASDRLGEPTDRAGLWMADALTVEPAVVLETWLSGSTVRRAEVIEVEAGVRPAVRLADGGRLEADAVVLAAGWASVALGAAGLKPVRGQLAWFDGPPPTPAVWGAGYAVPTRSGVLVGATHDRGRTDTVPDAGDQAQLLDRLTQVRPGLARGLDPRTGRSRAAVRAATPDHLPLCGPLADGLWCLTGLGGRGFAWAPLLAEHLAATVVGAPSPLPGPLVDLVHPMRPSASGS